MAGFVSLNALVEAIAGAVTEAQEEIERSQIAGLAKFFDGEGRPASLQLRLPSLRLDAAPGEEDVYTAPILSLLPHSPLRIKQVDVSFDVQLGDLSPPDAAAQGKAAAAPAALARTTAVRQTLSVDPAPSADPARSGTVAHVVLTVECLEQPEGLARLIAEMVKTQGVRPSGPGDTPTGDPAAPAPTPAPPAPAASVAAAARPRDPPAPEKAPPAPPAPVIDAAAREPSAPPADKPAARPTKTTPPPSKPKPAS